MLRTAAVAALSLTAACGKVLPPTADAHAGTDASGLADAREDAALPIRRELARRPSRRRGVHNTSNWNCASGVDCEDVYDFDINGSGMLMATVSGVTGSSVPRLSLYKGATASGTNLFDNTTAPVCGTQDMALGGGPATVSATHYRLAVGRDWGNSGGAAGNHTISVTMTGTTLVADGQTSNDTASSEGHCP